MQRNMRASTGPRCTGQRADRAATPGRSPLPSSTPHESWPKLHPKRTTYRELIETLRTKRLALAKSGLAVDLRLGITESSTVRWENGHREPRFEDVLDLAHALGLDVVIVPAELVDYIRNILEEHGCRNGSEPEPHRSAGSTTWPEKSD